MHAFVDVGITAGMRVDGLATLADSDGSHVLAAYGIKEVIQLV